MIAFVFPPSVAKVEGGNPFAPNVFDYRARTTFNYFHELIPDRRAVIDQLQAAVGGAGKAELRDIFGDGDPGQGVELTRNIYESPLMAARKRYAPGVMYQSMDFDGLPTGAQRRLLEDSIIVSGLFGLLRPDDLVPNYSLSMAATIPGLGPLVEYWKARISPLLNSTFENCFVWDLLPDAYRAAWDDDESHNGRALVRFHDSDGRICKDDLAYRGQLINYLVCEAPVGLNAVRGWRHPAGFRLDEDRSDLDGPILSVVMSRR